MSPGLRRAWRTAAALPLTLLVLLYLARVGEPAYYGPGALSQAAAAIAVVAPVCAALGAFEGARLRQANVHFLAPVRGEVAIALRSLVPILAAGLVAVAVGAARMAAGTQSLAVDDLVVLAVPVAVLAAHTSLGYALGRHLTAVFSVPLALVGSWLWLVYPVALEPLWVRHLTGYPQACCDVSTVPAPGAIAAPVVLATAAVLAAAALLTHARPAVRGVAAAVLAAAGFAAAIPLVDELGAEPTSARSEHELRCRGEAPRVCLWPEHEDVAELVASEASAMQAELAAIGVETPGTVSEAAAADGRAWFVGVHPTLDRESVRLTLLQGLLPTVPSCAEMTPYVAYAAYWPMALWLGRRTGIEDEALATWTTPEDRREAAAVERLDPDAQLAWYRANRRALGRCDVDPILVASR